jgi:hypothetical protein
LMTQLERMASTVVSGKGRCSISPSRNSTFEHSFARAQGGDGLRIAAAESEISPLRGALSVLLRVAHGETSAALVATAAYATAVGTSRHLGICRSNLFPDSIVVV